jgi:hypothetical protein
MKTTMKTTVKTTVTMTTTTARQMQGKTMTTTTKRMTMTSDKAVSKGIKNVKLPRRGKRSVMRKTKMTTRKKKRQT